MTPRPSRLQDAARRWGWLLLLALAPLFLFISPSTGPVLLVVPALLAVLWAGADHRAANRTPLDWALLLLAVMLLVSLWATFSILFSLPKIAGLVFGLGLFYATVAYGQAVARGRASPGGWVWVAAVYLALGAVVAAIGLLGTRWTSKVPILASIAARLPADLIALPGAQNGLQPNEVAGVLVWVVPVAIGLAAALWLNFDALVQARGGPPATVAVVSSTLVALGTGGVLVLTQSRSALFGLALALIAMLLLTGRRVRRVTLALLFVGSLAVVVLYGQRLKPYYDYAVYGTTISAANGTVGAASGASADPGRFFAGVNQRVEIWSRAVYGIQDFALTGMGLNTFRKLVFVLYPLSLVSPATDLGHAHNTWLQVALDLGLPGLVAYLGVCISTVGMLLQALRRFARGAPLLRALALGLLGALAGSFGYGLTDTVSLGARPGFIWWLMLALAVLVWNQSQRQNVYSVGDPAAA